MKKLLFLLIAGFLTTATFAQAGKMGKNVEQQIKKLSAALDAAGVPLNGDQKSDMMTSLTNTMKQMKEARALGTSDRSAVDRVRRASEAEVKGILTPAQFTVFQDMKSNARRNGEGGIKAGGAGTLGSKKDQSGDWDENPNKRDRRDKADDTSRVLTDEEVAEMEEKKKKAMERKAQREAMSEEEKMAKKAERDAMSEEEKAAKKAEKMAMKEAKSNDKEWAKDTKRANKRNAKEKSMARVSSVTNALSNAKMPLSDTQVKQVKTVMMQEQKKVGNLLIKTGDANSGDYLKGLKKIKKGSTKKMKSFLSKEQFKFLKKASL